MSRTVWRITTQRFAADAFSGEGARLYGGRWNRKGEAVAYTAESRSLALLEMLVQDEPLRAKYVLIPAVIPDDLHVEQIQTAELPADWRSLEGRSALQELGSAWLERAQSCVLLVPSAVLPAEQNILFNPLHQDFQRIQIGAPEILLSDLRLMRNLSQS
jgi:RES domain-containing protein